MIHARDRPRWLGPQQRVEAWRALGASEYVCRNIKFGISDPPTVPFTEGTLAPEIPQTPEDLEFGTQDLKQGCLEGIYEEVLAVEVEHLRRQGLMVSNAFVVWEERDGPASRKGRFVVNFSDQSLHWPKGSLRMETLPGFSLQVGEGDHMVSFDIRSGYRHFRLAPGMQKYFLFRYHGRFYKCVALPFGWGRSPLWFTELLRPFVSHLRGAGFRVLAYLDDFLIIPSPSGIRADKGDCRRATKWIEGVMWNLGLTRHPNKGEWHGSTRVQHLGVIIDTMRMRYYVAPAKVARVRALAAALLKQARLGRRWVSREKVRSFCGICVSLTLAMPFARYHCRSLYDALTPRRNPKDAAAARPPRAARGGARVRLSHAGLRDLRVWQRLTSTLDEGRDILPRKPDGILHTDAAEVGYGGTLARKGVPGDPGEWESQAIWTAGDREDCITVRELRSVRLLLEGRLGERSQEAGMRLLRLCGDNTGVVAVARTFTSASRPMMRELRRLKATLDARGLRLQPEWLPSAANKFADALSRRFPAGDVGVTTTLVRSVLDEISSPTGRLRYPRTLGAHPVYARRHAFEELSKPWEANVLHVLYPPPDLALATVRRLRLTKVPAVLLLPDWPRQAWWQEAANLCSTSYRAELTGSAAFTGHRTVNPAWGVRVFLVRTPAPPLLSPDGPSHRRPSPP